ncbi:MAG: glycosyltransferase family 2 protein [Bacteroidota bacterium]
MESMKVSGFSFIRNAVKFDYPVVEAITSILPVCDEFVLALGNSDDETEALITSINSPKMKIIHTVWDETLREGGRVLADETNKAFDAVAADSDWAFYIQADEIIHEKYLAEIKSKMLLYKDDKYVEGLLFNYKHFYGSYDYVGDSRRWYRKEVRVIRNDKSIRSYRDAMGFRLNDRKLNVKPIEASVYHYGWVKPPEQQQAKQQYFHSLWHDEQKVQRMVGTASEFDYSQIDSLALFTETHPQIMQKRIAEKNWSFDFDPTKKKLSLKNKLLHSIEKATGWKPGEYRNYKIIR